MTTVTIDDLCGSLLGTGEKKYIYIYMPSPKGGSIVGFATLNRINQIDSGFQPPNV